MKPNSKKQYSALRLKIHEIIFEADTLAGKIFDVCLLVLILLSVLAVMLESVEQLDRKYHRIFLSVEWLVTIFFTIEYALRIYAVKKPWKYMSSFYGIIDLLAILPTYLTLFGIGIHYLITVRALRLFRVFRIFKLARFVMASTVLTEAIRASRVKITVFLTFVLTVVCIIGSVMYLIEGEQNSGFDNIPRGVYWAIVTITTVGYGDIAPVTTVGQFLASILMILGYGVIAVPTGIVSVEIANAQSNIEKKLNTRCCKSCGSEGHESDAAYCKFCGHELYL